MMAAEQSSMDLPSLLKDLVSSETGLDRRLELLQSVKQVFDRAASTPAAGGILRTIFPAMCQVLQHNPAQLDQAADAAPNRLRGTAVELLGRIGVTDLPKQYVADALGVWHSVLMTDSEDNGMVAQRVIFDIHKAWKQGLEEPSGPFFEWLKLLYEGYHAAYQAQVEGQGDVAMTPGTLVPARSSFKLAAEVALLVVFLFNCYPRRLQQYAPVLLPLMVQAVSIAGPHPSNVPESRQPAYNDFRMSQIKVVAFLSVMGRSSGLAQLLAPHKDTICTALMRLLESAPDNLTHRKEVLVAAKNLLNTPFRSGLYSRMDQLLEETTLLGSSRTCVEGLRSVAYSMLAELVVAARAEMSFPQLQKAVHIFTRHAHDCTVPAALQSASLRLLYNLIETIFGRRTDARLSESYRGLLRQILDCFVSKLGTLRVLAPRMIAEVKQLEKQRAQRKAAEAAEAEAHETEWQRAAKKRQEQHAAAAAAAEAAAEKAAAEAAAQDEVKAEPDAAAAMGAMAAPTDVPTADGTSPAAVASAAAEPTPMQEDTAGDAAVEKLPLGEGEGDEETKAAEGAEGAGGEEGAEGREEAAAAPASPAGEGARREAFRTLLPQLSQQSSGKEKEVAEYRNLLNTTILCLKSILFTTVAFHTNRGLQGQQLSFPIKPWNRRDSDVRTVSRIVSLGLPALALYEVLPSSNDTREAFADLFTQLQNPQDFADIISPRMPFIYDTVLQNGWYLKFVSHLIQGDVAARNYVNRHMIVCVLRFLVSEKLPALADMSTPDAQLTAQLFEMCFEALPRIQAQDAAPQRAAQLIQLKCPTVEAAALPQLVKFTEGVLPRLSEGAEKSKGYLRVLKSLFFSLAAGSFEDVKTAFSGRALPGGGTLHGRVVDLTLAMMQGPGDKEQAELASQLCLLAPAHYQGLIPHMTRMMHAVTTALEGGSQSVGVALKVLDMWGDHFNPEFLERCMAGVVRPLMMSLWSHLKPAPYPHGTKVAEVLGKMGGRNRRWLIDGMHVPYRTTPEYGLRIILGFVTHTSFLVPLDNSVKLARATVEDVSQEPHLRRHSLRLLQLCLTALCKLELPADVAEGNPLARLQGVLFGGEDPPLIPSEFYWPQEMGVKTRQQHQVEQQMLQQLLLTVMSSCGDPELGEGAREFAVALSRHFALLFAAGWGSQTPPPAPPSSRYMKYAALGGIPAMVAALKHLDPHLILDSFEQGLCLPQESQRAAIVDCMAAFLEVMLAVGEVQQAQRAQQGPEQGSQEGRSQGRESGSGKEQRSAERGAAEGRKSEEGGKDAGASDPPSRPSAAAAEEEGRNDTPGAGVAAAAAAATPLQQPGHEPVLLDLLHRAMHCCYGESWASRMGGVAALKLLATIAPTSVLRRPASLVVKAILGVMRGLPDHAVDEQQQLKGVVTLVVRRCMGLPALEDHKKVEEMHVQEQQADVTLKGDEAVSHEGADVAMESDPGAEPASSDPRSASEPGANAEGVKESTPEPAAATAEDSKGSEESAKIPKEPEASKDADMPDADAEAQAKTTEAAADPAEGALPLSPPQQQEDSTQNEGKGSKAGGAEGEVEALLKALVESLTRELVSSKSNDAVRGAAAACLQLVATCQGSSISEVLSGMLDRLVPHLKERRMLPLKNITAQINYACSTAFIIRTCPSQIPLLPEFALFTADICSLLETDDADISKQVLVRGHPPKPEAIRKLRESCMEMLCAVLGWKAFRDEESMKVTQQVPSVGGTPAVEVSMPLPKLRERIIKINIKELGSPHLRVSQLAAEGLQVVQEHSMLGKNVLQEGLRPILTDFAFYNRITLPLLRHLHRMLDVLRGQFNVTLGDKMVEHLKKWIEVEKHIHPAPRSLADGKQLELSWESGTECEVAAAMLDIFHKLPPQAKKFLESHGEQVGLVVLTIGLEDALHKLPGPAYPSKKWSPYRAPLARFLNRYPQDSVLYFLDITSGRLPNPEYFHRLLDIVRSPLGKPLLEALAGAADRLAGVLTMPLPEGGSHQSVHNVSESQFNCIHLIRSMTKLLPAWLPRQLFQALVQRWQLPQRKARLAMESELPRQQVMESKRLAHAILNWVSRNPEDFQVLFDLLTIFSSGTAVDFTFLKMFCQTTVAEEFDINHKKLILLHWVQLRREGRMSQDDQVNVLRLLINPMVKWAVTHDQHDMLTPEVVSSVVKDVFVAQSSEGEQIQMELVQLLGTLLQNAHGRFVQYRRELIGFGWSILAANNSAKVHACLAVAHFFQAFETPEKVMKQVYHALLRLMQSDHRDVVPHARDVSREAIDIIIGIMEERYQEGQASGGGGSGTAAGAVAEAQRGIPDFVLATKQVLAEDGHTGNTLMQVFQTIVRNSDIFFPSRGLFMASMLASLNRLGLPGSSSLETRAMAVDLAATLLRWDSRAAAEEEENGGAEGKAGGEDKDAMEVDAADSAAKPEATPAPVQAPPAAADAAADAAGAAAGADAQPPAADNAAGQAGAASAAAAGGSTTPGGGGSGSEGSGDSRPRDPSRLTPTQNESLVNFLIRIAFISGESKERDEAGWRKLHTHVLEVLRDAARLRHSYAINLRFFEKTLASNLQHQQQQMDAAARSGQPFVPEPPPALMTGLRVANIYLEHQPESFLSLCANQMAMMMEPSVLARQRAPADLLAKAMQRLISHYPPGTDATGTAAEYALKLQARLQEIINKYFSAIGDTSQTLSPDSYLHASNCLLVMKEAMEISPKSMQQLIGSLLKAMNRMAKEHNQNPQASILAAKAGTPPREVPGDSEFGTGSWLMWNALNLSAPSALVLSPEHRKHFLSTLIMLITGQSVRVGQTDPALLFAILGLVRQWLLESDKCPLSARELCVVLQRIAQLERLNAIPTPLKDSWDDSFLDLLYTIIDGGERKVALGAGGEVLSGEVFIRVEKSLCCGLNSTNPKWRNKFFKLYTQRVPGDLFERLHYIIQVQDWTFIAHTFWLRHAVALLLDCMTLENPITLAYNSAHVPPLFNYKQSLEFPATALKAAQRPQLAAPSAPPGDASGPAGAALPLQAAPDAQPAAAGEGAMEGAGGVKQEGDGQVAAGEAVVKLEPATEEAQVAVGAEAAAPAPAAMSPGGEQPMDVDAAAAAAPAVAVDDSDPAVAAAPAPAPTTTAPSGLQGPSSVLATAPSTSDAVPPPSPPGLELDLPLPPSLHTLLTQQVDFLRNNDTLRGADLVSCMIELLQADPHMAHHLWVLLFPIVWSSLHKEHQTALAKPIILLLQKEHQTHQVGLRPTVCQTLLEGISLSQPQPKIVAEMIKYMGKHFHAPHTAISMLESHVTLFPQDMRCFESLCDLYTTLGEEDVVFGLWQRRAATEETKLALALHQQGYLVQAQAQYLEMMSRGVAGGVTGVTKSEMVLWQKQYLACCRELNQWEVINDYAKVTDNTSLQMETLPHLLEWTALKQGVLSKAQVEEGAEFSLVHVQQALSEMQVTDVDKWTKQALAQLVHKWWTLPDNSPACFTPLMHDFQRAVELQETWRIVVEFGQRGGPRQSYDELKEVTENTWKLRLPNEWEPVRWWSDLLTWRCQVHNSTINMFKQVEATFPSLYQMGYRDKAWSVNRLGHVARLHYQPDACVHIINNMYGFNAMEVQEAFVKVVEQAKAYLLKPDEHLHGLNLISSTNLEYFQPQHQAEMINLKAQFLAALGEDDSAHATFSEALMLFTLCSEAWIAWGRFCDAMYTKTQQSSWLDYLGSCFMQSLRLGSQSARVLVPRLLQLLMLDGMGAEVIGKHITAQVGDLPAWVWLPYLQHLLISLQRPEMQPVKKILAAVTEAHPQYVYWHVRPALLQAREAAVKSVNDAREKAKQQKEQQQQQQQGAGAGGAAAGEAGTAGSAGGTPPQAATQPPTSEAGTPAAAGGGAAASAPAAAPNSARPSSPALEKTVEVVAYEGVKEVRDLAASKMGSAWQQLEILMTQLAGAFTLRPDERLLAVINTLLARTYKTPLPSGSPVPEAFQKELQNVCQACSRKEAQGGGSRLVQYQLQFARDLDPGSAAAPKTLGELTDKLKGWRLMLETVIDDIHPPLMKTESEAPSLMELAFEDLEMPGQQLPAPDAPEQVLIDRIGSTVEVVRRNNATYRRITIHGSDGRPRTFLVHWTSGGGMQTASDERVLSLLRCANQLLLSHPEARKRCLQFNAPAIITLSGARLFEDDPSAVPYSDAYDTNCLRYGREADAPIQVFKSWCCTNDGMSQDPTLRRQAYDEICKHYVSENILTQYMYKTMNSTNNMWVFKKQFTLSMAMMAVSCHALLLTGRSPGRILISKASGVVGHVDLAPSYDQRFVLERGSDTVPFRLTRSMQAFLGPHCVEGVLVAAGTAAAQALQQEHSNLPALLALFFRDEILTWACRRAGARSIGALSSQLRPQQLAPVVGNNVRGALDRVSQMGPSNSVTFTGPQPPAAGGATPTAAAAPGGGPHLGMRALVEAATSPANLCRMEPTWHPWF